MKPRAASSVARALRRGAGPLALLAGTLQIACGPPPIPTSTSTSTPTPTSTSTPTPTPTPTSTSTPTPTSTPTCAALRDPEGWFALGPSEPPTQTFPGPASSIGRPGELVGIGPTGEPWVVMTNAKLRPMLGHVVQGRIAFEEIEGFPATEGPHALGFRGDRPMLLSHTRRVVREPDGFHVETLAPPPDLLRTTMVVDQANDAWLAALEHHLPPYDPCGRSQPQQMCDPEPPPPALWTRLHVAKLVGSVWKELPTVPVSKDASSVVAATDGEGHVSLYVMAPGRRAEPFHVGSKGALQKGENPARVPARAGGQSAVFARKGTHQVGVFAPLHYSSHYAFAEATGDLPMHPLGGAWATGLAQVRLYGNATDATVSMDACGTPTVTWKVAPFWPSPVEQTAESTLQSRQWTGDEWRELPDTKTENWRALPGGAETRDARGRPISVSWDGRLHVQRKDGATSRELEPLPDADVIGTPKIAAANGRVCVAWLNAGEKPTVFARCHKDELGP